VQNKVIQANDIWVSVGLMILRTRNRRFRGNPGAPSNSRKISSGILEATSIRGWFKLNRPFLVCMVELMQEVESVQPTLPGGLRPQHVRNAAHRNRKAIADKLQAVCDLYAALLSAELHAMGHHARLGTAKPGAKASFDAINQRLLAPGEPL